MPNQTIRHAIGNIWTDQTFVWNPPSRDIVAFLLPWRYLAGEIRLAYLRACVSVVSLETLHCCMYVAARAKIRPANKSESLSAALYCGRFGLSGGGNSSAGPPVGLIANSLQFALRRLSVHLCNQERTAGGGHSDEKEGMGY